MKNGRSLTDLALEIERQQQAKKDYIVSTDVIEMKSDGEGRFSLDVDAINGTFGIKDTAHDQIGQYTEIPSKYYDRMRKESPELLTLNVNHWLHSTPERRMLRTLDGDARAFLSSRYRRIDNAQIAETVLPIIMQMKGAKVESCEITDTKMYLKVINPRIQSNVDVGDAVQAGVVISNSEVGRGSVTVSPLIFRLVCSNGMIAQDSQVRRYHIGKENDVDLDMTVFTDETLEADDRALMLKIRDAVTAAVEQTRFDRLVEQMREAKDAKVEARIVPKAVELTSKQFGVTTFESEGVLGHMIGDGELSLYGLANAITRHAQDVQSYDRSTELEATGYRVLTIAPQLWKSILSTARKEV